MENIYHIVEMWLMYTKIVTQLYSMGILSLVIGVLQKWQPPSSGLNMRNLKEFSLQGAITPLINLYVFGLQLGFPINSVVILIFLGVSPTERMRNLKSPVRSSIPKLGSPIPSPMPGLQKLPQCTRCCNGIVWVFNSRWLKFLVNTKKWTVLHRWIFLFSWSERTTPKYI